MDEKLKALLKKIKKEAEDELGQSLRSLALYGSAASDDYIPGVSDINLLFILHRADADALHRLQKLWKGWRRKGVAPPLVMEEEDTRRSLDSFPIEFLTMKLSYQVLLGEDPLAALEIKPEHLRLQAEREAKGLVIRLRRAYLEMGISARELQILLRESIKTVLILLRCALWLFRADPAGMKEPELLAAGEEKLGLKLAASREVLALRLEKAKKKDQQLRELFAAYLEEVRAFAEWIDRWKPE